MGISTRRDSAIPKRIHIYVDFVCSPSLYPLQEVSWDFNMCVLIMACIDLSKLDGVAYINLGHTLRNLNTHS